MELQARGYLAEGLHGDMTQAQRDRVMDKFRKNAVEVLVATDVAARGLDVGGIEAVFNYDLPQDDEYYVHRIGRTARAGKTGKGLYVCRGPGNLQASRDRDLRPHEDQDAADPFARRGGGEQVRHRPRKGKGADRRGQSRQIRPVDRKPRGRGLRDT